MTQARKPPTDAGKYVSVNGLDMYYEEHGNGPPLVLLHCGSCTARMWELHLPAFVPHFRVITPDNRAHGRTNNPLGELSYPLMADDTAALIRELNLTTPLVFGYSDGAQIALEFGMRYPGQARAIVVGGASYKLDPLLFEFFRTMGMEGPGVVNLEHLQRGRSDWIAGWEVEHFRADDPLYWQTLVRQLSSLWWTAPDYTDADLGKITDPILILHGDRDGVVPVEQALEMFHRIPQAELAILPNTTHFTALNQLSTGIVLDFFVRHKVVSE